MSRPRYFSLHVAILTRIEVTTSLNKIIKFFHRHNLGLLISNGIKIIAKKTMNMVLGTHLSFLLVPNLEYPCSIQVVFQYRESSLPYTGRIIKWSFPGFLDMKCRHLTSFHPANSLTRNIKGKSEHSVSEEFRQVRDHEIVGFCCISYRKGLISGSYLYRLN